MSKVGQGQSREGANLAVYCDRISVPDEIVFERTGDVDTDVVQFPVPSFCFTIQVSDTQYAKKDRRYKSSITCSHRLFLPLFLTPQDFA